MNQKDPQRRDVLAIFTAAGLLIGILVILLVPKWDAPWDPIESTEWGWRGLAMDTFTSERTRNEPWNVVPPPIPVYGEFGEKAGDVYENVQVLGDLDAAEFDRTMAAITEWIAPVEGCGYCHDLERGFAYDEIYTKKVSRRMLMMVRQINSESQHVKDTGVTCYTCHRGQAIPPFHWFKADTPKPPMGGIVGTPPPWNRRAETIRDFFPRRSFEDYLLKDTPISGAQARQVAAGEVTDLEELEHIYIFMMQMSDGLGVNCTFCHNSRAFYDWSQSTPNRVQGWYGIRLTRYLNNAYIEPLTPLIPDSHLGPLGDIAKIDCMTCHAGQRRPLAGYPMAGQYPGLAPDGNMRLPDPDEFAEAAAQ